MSFAHLYQKPADRQFVYDQIKQRTELLKKTEKQLEFLKKSVIKFKGEAKEYLTMGELGTFTLEDDEDGGYELIQHFDCEATAEVCETYSELTQLEATGCEHKIKMLKILTLFWKNVVGKSSIAFETLMLKKLTEAAMEYLESYNDLVTSKELETVEAVVPSVGADKKDGNYKTTCDSVMNEIKLLKRLHQKHIHISRPI